MPHSLNRTAASVLESGASMEWFRQIKFAPHKSKKSGIGAGTLRELRIAGVLHRDERNKNGSMWGSGCKYSVFMDHMEAQYARKHPE